MASRGQTTESNPFTMSGLIDAWIEEDERRVEAQPERVDPFMTVTVSKLKERGWTDTAIQKFAGPPAYTVPNPGHVSGTSTRLWKLSEIILIEESNEFQSWRAMQASRHAASPLDILRERIRDGYSVEVLRDEDLESAAFSRDHIDACMLCDYSRIHNTRDSYLASYVLRHLLTESNDVSEAVRDIARLSSMDVEKANRMTSAQKFDLVRGAYPALESHFAHHLNVEFLLW